MSGQKQHACDGNNRVHTPINRSGDFDAAILHVLRNTGTAPVGVTDSRRVLREKGGKDPGIILHCLDLSRCQQRTTSVVKLGTEKANKLKRGRSQNIVSRGGNGCLNLDVNFSRTKLHVDEYSEWLERGWLR